MMTKVEKWIEVRIVTDEQLVDSWLVAGHREIDLQGVWVSGSVGEVDVETMEILPIGRLQAEVAAKRAMLALHMVSECECDSSPCAQLVVLASSWDEEPWQLDLSERLDDAVLQPLRRKS